jgi:cation transport ATPase
MPPAEPNAPSPDPISSEPASPQSSRSRHEQDQGSSEDRQLNIAEMMIGTAMMFVGFLNILLSISGGYEMAGVIPVLLYFGGLAIWAHATITNLTLRYIVITVAVTLALAFFHYGEVLFWHKQAIFWATIAMVAFFMFKTANK